MRWFRFYSEALNDPKVQQLSSALFKYWVNLLCVANETEPRGTIKSVEVPYKLRIREVEWQRARDYFREVGLLDGEDEDLSIHGWDQRQFSSDDTTARVGKWKRDKRVAGNVATTFPTPLLATVPDTEQKQSTDPETETEHRQTVRALAPEAFPEEESARFTALYRVSHEQSTGRLITSYRMSDAIDIAKTYGDEECIAVAALLGWDKAPKYYIAKLEERRNGNRDGTSSRQPGPRPDTESVANRVQRLVSEQSRVSRG